METQGDTLVITRRWRNLSVWFLLFFALLWNGFLVVWHRIALSTGAWFMSAFGLIHTGVGLFLIYYVAALSMNSTVIRASPRGLESKSGPLPWKGDRQLGAGTVSQLYRLFEVTGILASPTTVNPHFLALRSDPMAFSGASRRKQSHLAASGDSMAP